MLVEYFKNLVAENEQMENVAEALVKTDEYALGADDVRIIDCYELYRYMAGHYDYPDNKELAAAVRKIAPGGIAVLDQFESVLVMEYIDIFEPENKRYTCYAA